MACCGVLQLGETVLWVQRALAQTCADVILRHAGQTLLDFQAL